MTLPRVHVVSTGFRHSTRHVCEASVRAQLGVEAVHHYIEASEQDPPKTKMENLVDVIGTLPADAVTVCLDGDDWLASRYALRRVAQAHDEGAWVTWGSFRNSDGSGGFANKYEEWEDYRRVPWKMTHVKTFRAGLFQRIPKEYLQYEPGKWIDRGDDPAFMWSVAELAGRDRCKFLNDVLYIYAVTEAWHRTASTEERQHEANMVTYARALPPLERLNVL